MGEESINFSLVEVSREMFGEEAADKMTAIPLSNKTIHHRISMMATDIEKQVVQMLKDFPWLAV